MDNIPYTDIDYCKYGMPYRKRTRLWNNVFNWIPQPLCKKDCNSRNGNKHIAEAQRLTTTPEGVIKNFNQNDLYKIPGLLIKEIFESINNNSP